MFDPCKRKILNPYETSSTSSTSSARSSRHDRNADATIKLNNSHKAQSSFLQAETYSSKASSSTNSLRSARSTLRNPPEPSHVSGQKDAYSVSYSSVRTRNYTASEKDSFQRNAPSNTSRSRANSILSADGRSKRASSRSSEQAPLEIGWGWAAGAAATAAWLAYEYLNPGRYQPHNMPYDFPYDMPYDLPYDMPYNRPDNRPDRPYRPYDIPDNRDPWETRGANDARSMVRPNPEGRGNGILIKPNDND